MIDEQGNGNFIGALQMISKHNHVIKHHLENVARHQQEGSRMQAHYLSWQSQNEFIKECASVVKESVLKEIKASIYYTIITDGTPDESHTEQITFVLRFVFFKTDEKKWEIRERFLGVEDMEKKKGVDIANLIFDVLAREKIDLKNCRGQGYDNGSNMAGTHIGAQALVLKKNSMAVYVPCSAHSLNLAGVHAAESSAEMKTFFGNIQALYVFFSCSPARWKILLESTGISLHKLSDTRWSARIDAVKPLAKRPREIITALDYCVDKLDLTGEMVNQAKSLKKWLKSFDTVVLLTVWLKTLQAVDDVSRLLQSNSIAIDDEIILINQLLDDLGRIRSSWNELLSEAKLVAESLGFEKDFEVKRTRKTKRHHDEPPNTAYFHDGAEKKFEVSVFNVGLDHLIQQIRSRFKVVKEVYARFDFIWSLTDDIVAQERKARELAKFYSTDVNEEDLVAEIRHFDRVKGALFNPGNSLKLLNQIFSKGLEPMFPSICILLRIFNTMSVSVAEGERSFSKMKIIKNYFRATMGQERLSSLMMLSIENELARSVSYEEVISNFASRKARKICLA